MSQQKYDTKQLEYLIQTAVKKIGGGKENDICRYLPVPTGGYIHHFTMRKMKTEAPEQLHNMIVKYIVNTEQPITIVPKPRAARGSRKKKDQVLLTKQDIERLLHIARAAGDKDMVRRLTPKRDLRSVKRELLASIRAGEIRQDLWSAYVDYVEAVSVNNQLTGVSA